MKPISIIVLLGLLSGCATISEQSELFRQAALSKAEEATEEAFDRTLAAICDGRFPLRVYRKKLGPGGIQRLEEWCGDPAPLDTFATMRVQACRPLMTMNPALYQSCVMGQINQTLGRVWAQ